MEEQPNKEKTPKEKFYETVHNRCIPQLKRTKEEDRVPFYVVKSDSEAEVFGIKPFQKFGHTIIRYCLDLEGFYVCLRNKNPLKEEPEFEDITKKMGLSPERIPSYEKKPDPAGDTSVIDLRKIFVDLAERSLKLCIRKIKKFQEAEYFRVCSTDPGPQPEDWNHYFTIRSKNKKEESKDFFPYMYLLASSVKADIHQDIPSEYSWTVYFKIEEGNLEKKLQNEL